MLKRLYVDNYKALSSFKMEFSNLSLLLGPNGAGKTTVLEVLDQLRRFVCTGWPLLRIDEDPGFAPPNTLTRWDTRLDQRFVLDVELDSHIYEYELVIRHNQDRTKRRVFTETLRCDDHVLFLMDEEGEAHLHNNSGDEKATMPFDWSRSALGTIRPGPNNTLLTQFRDWLAAIQWIKPVPYLMESISRTATSIIQPNLQDFANWIRGQFESGRIEVFKVNQLLNEIIDGFRELNALPDGDARRLKVQIHGVAEGFDFKELSDGQKLLIALYFLSSLMVRDRRLLLLDEPDNYLSLREIQPWINYLKDTIEQFSSQAFIVSHHPEILDQLALTNGSWLYRKDGNSPTDVKAFRDVMERFKDALPPSEIISLGWDKE